MVVSYAGDMMQSSTVDEGFAEEFRKLHHRQETLLSANEKLKRDLQIEVDSRHALEESIKMQKSVYDSLITVREELAEAKKETKRATEQYLAARKGTWNSIGSRRVGRTEIDCGQFEAKA
jgi:bacterioferritin (cytochrome b1)